MKTAKDIFMYALAGLTMALLFTCLYLILFHAIPADNKDLAYMGLGLAFGWGTMIISYFFGSSKSSADKSETIDKKLNS
jgi:hypothetical protein